MEKDGWVTIAFQHLVLHAFVAVSVSTLPSGCVDQNLPLGYARCGVEEQLAALQFEGAMGRMQAATERPVNLGLGWIEYYLQALVLAVVLRVGKRSNENKQSCNDAGELKSHTPRPPSGQVRPKTENLLECARRDARPADGQTVAVGLKTDPWPAPA